MSYTDIELAMLSNRSPPASLHPADFQPIDQRKRKRIFYIIRPTRCLCKIQVARKISYVIHRDWSCISPPEMHLYIIDLSQLICPLSGTLNPIGTWLQSSSLRKFQKESLSAKCYTICLQTTSITLGLLQ